MIISAVLYCLRALNSENLNKEKGKWYVIRHIIIGCVGSSLFVWWSYELLIFHGLPESLCLATAGAIGYVGADVLANMIEKLIDRFINKF